MADSTVRGEKTAFSDYTTVLVARALYGVLALVGVTFTTRLLRPAQFGALSLFFVVSLLIVTASSAWTSAAVSRFGREELERTGRMTTITLTRAVFVVPAFLAAVPIVLAIEASGVLPDAFNTTLALLSIAYAAVWVMFDHVVYLLETWGRQKLSALALLIQQVGYVSAVAILYLAHVTVDAPDIALVAMAGMAALVGAIGFVVRRVGFGSARPDRATIRRVWSYSGPLIAFVVSQYVMRSVDVLVIGAFSTAAAVGTYALAYQGYGVIQSLAATAGPVFTPLLVSLRIGGRESALRLFLERVVPKLFYIAAVTASLAMAPIFALVPHVFGPGFANARFPLVLLLSAGAAFFAASLLGSVVTVFDRTRATAAINIAAAATNAALDLILIGGLGAGIWGPALATVTSIAVIWIGYSVVAADCLGLRPRPVVGLLAPLVAGTLPLILLNGALALLVSEGAAAATSTIIFVYGPLFQREDAGLLEALDMPESMRRLTARLLQLTRA
jgi:O-antigen/teichoic acid export membrane protein